MAEITAELNLGAHCGSRLSETKEGPVPVEFAVGDVSLGDYDQIREAIAFLSDRQFVQPNLSALSDHLGLSDAHCQRLFKRWCGLTPKDFVAALTLDRARNMLEAGSSVFDAAVEAGLSGSGRLHDLFVQTHAMTPGEHKLKGAGLQMSYGAHATPFGAALAVATERGLAGFAFVNEDAGQGLEDVLVELKSRWPAADYIHQPDVTLPYVDRIFALKDWSQERPVQLVLIGTDFEVRVWRALLKVPMGSAVSYGALAEDVSEASAARAVGQAVGRNPLSFVVPCHRVRRADGQLGGYHWGVTRKQAIIGWEAGQLLR